MIAWYNDVALIETTNVILIKFSSLTAPKIVKMTTSGAASDEISVSGHVNSGITIYLILGLTDIHVQPLPSGAFTNMDQL